MDIHGRSIWCSSFANPVQFHISLDVSIIFSFKSPFPVRLGCVSDELIHSIFNLFEY